ncbi:hypothetical protein E2C01_005386 [Portunus trituberculatus]|uniref:Uncharacterized protein n=1 Tax=Portunus trituberculatus TaxID=210409 RepID=A0A5B7CV05_PORTR|nr:hypothetical protein [Portunus trituberculatus]
MNEARVDGRSEPLAIGSQECEESSFTLSEGLRTNLKSEETSTDTRGRDPQMNGEVLVNGVNDEEGKACPMRTCNLSPSSGAVTELLHQDKDEEETNFEVSELIKEFLNQSSYLDEGLNGLDFVTGLGGRGLEGQVVPLYLEGSEARSSTPDSDSNMRTASEGSSTPTSQLSVPSSTSSDNQELRIPEKEETSNTKASGVECQSVESSEELPQQAGKVRGQETEDDSKESAASSSSFEDPKQNQVTQSLEGCVGDVEEKPHQDESSCSQADRAVSEAQPGPDAEGSEEHLSLWENLPEECKEQKSKGESEEWPEVPVPEASRERLQEGGQDKATDVPTSAASSECVCKRLQGVEEGANVMVGVWAELRSSLRQLHRSLIPQAAQGTTQRSRPSLTRIKALANMLVSHDAHQLYLRLSHLAHELCIELKVRLLATIHDSPSPSQASAFIQGNLCSKLYVLHGVLD